MQSKRKVDIGLDISTSTVGVSVLDTHTGDVIKLSYVKLTSKKFKDLYDKGKEVESHFSSWVNSETEEVGRIFVEEAHMKFTPGFSSAKTLFSLATFNGVVCFKVFEYFKVKPIQIGVRTARSKLKIKLNFKDKSTSSKQKVLDIVMQRLPKVKWETKIAKTGSKKGQVVLTPQNFDMADAYVICRGGQITTPL